MKLILECVAGSLKGEAVELERGTLSIGRLPTNNIIVPPQDTLASRRHAVIIADGKHFFIVDQKSTNGTFLNRVRLVPLKKYTLTNGDRVQIGASLFVARIAPSKGSVPVRRKVSRTPERKAVQKPVVSNANRGSQLKVLEKIAIGGMSRIYKAIFLDTKQVVAIKLPKSEYINDPDILQMFKKEINLGIRLKHPNIVEVLYSIKFEGLPTMVMEYFPSVPLNKIIKDGASLENKLKIFAQTCDALYYVHRRGIVHNDIKPGNILVGKNYYTKITDFGTAGTPASLKTIGDKWKILGTLLYMSPEQARGKNIDFRSDIYSLGIVLYELLTGVNPFRKENANGAVQVIERQLSYNPPPPSEVNDSLNKSIDDVLMRALSKDPEKRYFNVAKFKEDVLKSF